MKFPSLPQILMLWLLALGFCIPGSAASASGAAPPAISLAELAQPQALGAYTRYFHEQGGPMGLDRALATFAGGKSSPGKNPILTFGIGSAPAWVHLTVANPDSQPSRRRLQVENSWLDNLEIHFVEQGGTIAAYSLGDDRPYRERPVEGRFFAVDHAFSPGITDIYLRVASPDPIVLPLFLLTPGQAVERERLDNYSYGFLYGYLIALLAYNAVLYISIRDRRYLLYGLFLAAFIAMNTAYTGHGFSRLWPDLVGLQRWIIPVFMVFYGVAGFVFAKNFLNTPATLPRANRFLNRSMALAIAGLAAAALFGSTQLHALLVAFVFTNLFSCTMLVLGVAALGAKVPSSRYFLLASIASMVGATLTALSVWGWIAYEDWRFRAVEIGMLVDATLLALALGSQFRAVQLEKAVADFARRELAKTNARLNATLLEVERLAATDRLTGLWNRRHFETVASGEMDRAIRYQNPISLVLFDIDHFKRINDTYGHQSGDQVLVELSQLVRHSLRESDTVTRWGGEEFLILMVQTPLAEAVAAAEKLRQKVEGHAFAQLPQITLSLGVAEWDRGKESLDTWIGRSDQALYRAKESGRNKVISHDPQFWSRSEFAKPLLQLTWSSSYECGHRQIDLQHQALFQSANRLLALLPALANPGSALAAREEALAVVDRLLAEVSEHFAAEEEVLASLEWPDLEDHRQEHQRLLRQAEKLRQTLQSGAPGLVTARIVDFLARKMVASHILVSDREYFPALCELPLAARLQTS